MAIVKKNRTTELGFGRAITSTTIENYAQAPFVIKKNEEAKRLLADIKLPPLKK